MGKFAIGVRGVAQLPEVQTNFWYIWKLNEVGCFR